MWEPDTAGDVTELHTGMMRGRRDPVTPAQKEDTQSCDVWAMFSSGQGMMKVDGIEHTETEQVCK